MSESKAPHIYKGLTLDKFQIEAIEALLNDYNVLVTAPTGAGKTLIAEFLIEHNFKKGVRTFYTSPIKALTNQKFMNFTEEFGAENVGIITGDVVINQEAPIIVMTTEIFRNMIYDADPRLDQVSHLIFDEIHFINDRERGTVWEESIIFAPPHIKFLALSATVSNAADFKNWLEFVRDNKTVLIKETHRPVPLEIYLVTPDRGIERAEKTVERLFSNPEKFKRTFLKLKKRGIINFKNTSLNTIVETILSKKQYPAIFFAFSRFLCEKLAKKYQNLNLLNEAEHAKLEAELTKLINQYNLENLPKADTLIPLLRRGIAFHHAGMLPHLKITVEKLFSAGLIKLLFATETFAVGVNMPAKTVAFESLTKYDGIRRRKLRTLEFQQMAGRAGRRGIDKKGWVYTMLDIDDPYALRRIIFSDPEPLRSQFDLSYSSILNLVATNGREGLFTFSRKSFAIWDVEKQLTKLQKKVGEVPCGKPTLIVDFLNFQKTRLFKWFSKKKIRRFNEALKKFECYKCPHLSKCKHNYSKKRRVYTKLKELENRIADAEGRTLNLVEARLVFLESLGYLSAENLTTRGEFARKLFGYELELAELFFEGAFVELSEEEIVTLIACLVYEERKGDKSKRIPKAIKRKLLKYRKILEKLQTFEFEITGTTSLKELVLDIATPAYLWASGEEFAKLEEVTSISAGDLLRAFQQTSEMLRQLIDASEGIVLDKLRSAKALVERDIVDAKSYLFSKELENIEN